jgi:PleD family two-component response regulator
VSNGIYPQEEFKKNIRIERARADRSNHKLSLVVFDTNSSDPKNKTISRLMEEIRTRIRSVDLAGWYDDQRLGIILPYTSNNGATQLTENICESLDESLPKPVCHVYTYPSDK